jgi:hypothetical protein
MGDFFHYIPKKSFGGKQDRLHLLPRFLPSPRIASCNLAQQHPQPGEEKAEVVADGGEDDVGSIPMTSAEVAVTSCG